MRNREEVVNIRLAEVLSGSGMQANPETISSTNKRPDVLMLYRGMRVVIEGKYASSGNAEKAVTKQTQERVDLGVAQIALAILYPETLRIPATSTVEHIKSLQYRFCVFSEAGQTPWRDGSLGEILGELRRVHETLCEQDVVQEAAKRLSGYLEGVALLLQENHGVCQKLAEVLGVGQPGSETKALQKKRYQTATRVAALTVANAFIFQEQLAASGVVGVCTLRNVLRKDDIVSKTVAHWDWICTTINYVPIFKIASEILAVIPGGTTAEKAVGALAEQALKVCENKAALRHDLMGRIYHFLLHEAKYLGTYYTSVPASTLLLKLALDPKRWKLDFSKKETLQNFRAADLTCGTGTLLMATCQSITDNYVIAAAKKKKLEASDFRRLHALLMEQIIHGYDVLSSAIHLTASTLALLAPEVSFKKLRLFSMPLSYRGKTARLGSLEFLHQPRSAAQLSLLNEADEAQEVSEVTGKGMRYGVAELPMIDLFIMNPPFVRSVNGNLLFGNLPDKHREKMQAALKLQVARNQLECNVTAGLGGVFLALADRYVKRDGRLAFVLPAALTTGIAWSETRHLITSRYHLEHVVVSHHANQWSFSENTDLSEVLLVARRLNENEVNDDLDTIFVNLWRNPITGGDALAIARLVLSKQPAVLGTPERPGGVAQLTELNRKYGEALSVPMKYLKSIWWAGAFAQTELNRAGWFLRGGQVTIPGSKPTTIKLVKLRTIATLGPDTRDVHDGFDVVSSPTPYPAFWNHDSNRVVSMFTKHSKWLSPRSSPAPGRKKIHPALTLWNKASRLLLAERLRLNSHRVTSLITDKEVLGNTWWEARLFELPAESEKVLTLFLNSSLGVLSLVFSRTPAQGAWINFKKPAMEELLVLDIASLDSMSFQNLVQAYDTLSNNTLLPFSQIAIDPVRIMLDRALSSALNLPDLAPLREMLGREPVVTDEQLLEEDKTAKDDPQFELALDVV